MLKNTLLQHAVLAGGLMLTSGFVMAQNNWVPSGAPFTIPFDAIVGGHDTPNFFPPRPGPPLYVCRGGSFEGYGHRSANSGWVSRAAISDSVAGKSTFQISSF